MTAKKTFDYIIKKYGVDPDAESPVRLDFRRDGIAKLFKDLGFTCGAEIGVDRGLYSRTLCEANPGVKLYCIDPWKCYEDYVDIISEKKFNKNYAHTKRLLEPYDCEIIKKSSMGALKDFSLDSLDFVYIDGNHDYDYVLKDIRGWSKIVRKGGIISGHDYKGPRKGRSELGRKPLVGVGQAVDLYIKENNIKMLFLTPARGDSSWFFVNE